MIHFVSDIPNIILYNKKNPLTLGINLSFNFTYTFRCHFFSSCI